MNQYDHLKNKLHNYKVEIDKEKLWAKTSHAIPQRKRRRAVLIMLFCVLVVSAWLLQSTSIAAIIERSLSHKKNSGNSGQLAQNLQVNTTETKTEWNNTPNKPLEVLSSKPSSSVAKLTEAINPRAEESFSKPVTGGGNTLVESSVNQIENAKILRAPLKTFILPILPLSPMFRRLYTSLFSAQQPGRQKIFHRFLEVALSERNTEAQSDNSIQIHNENENENIDAQNAHLVEKFIIPEHTDRAVNVPIAYLFKDISQIAIPVNTIEAFSSHKPGITPLKGRFLESLQMVQGVGFSTVKIHSLTPESDQYAARLEQTFRSLEIFSTTVSATLNLPERFSVETGLQVTRLSTVIDHEWETSERIQEEGVTSVIIDEHGISQSIIGNREFTRTTHYQAKRYTTHQNIDFILALHRVIWSEQRLSINAFVKGAYNLSYNAKGTILDSNGSLVSFSKEENPLRRNSPFAIGGGLQMMYQLNPHWSLTGNFTFDPIRYQFENENLPVRFLHSGLSLGLGIGYVF